MPLKGQHPRCPSWPGGRIEASLQGENAGHCCSSLTSLAWLEMYIIWLVVWNMNCIFHFIEKGCHPPHWRTHIFQDGYCITNQSWFIPLWKGTLEKKLWRYARRIWFLRLPDLILGEELRKPSINWWWWWWWDDDNHNGNGNDLPTYHCWPLPFMLNHYHWC